MIRTYGTSLPTLGWPTFTSVLKQNKLLLFDPKSESSVRLLQYVLKNKSLSKSVLLQALESPTYSFSRFVSARQFSRGIQGDWNVSRAPAGRQQTHHNVALGIKQTCLDINCLMLFNVALYQKEGQTPNGPHVNGK